MTYLAQLINISDLGWKNLPGSTLLGYMISHFSGDLKELNMYLGLMIHQVNEGSDPEKLLREYNIPNPTFDVYNYSHLVNIFIKDLKMYAELFKK